MYEHTPLQGTVFSCINRITFGYCLNGNYADMFQITISRTDNL